MSTIYTQQPLYLVEKKNPIITFCLNFFLFSGAGLLYLGGKYTNKGLIYMSITFGLVLFSIFTFGIGLILLLPWHIWALVDGFNSTNECNQAIELKNKDIIEQSNSKISSDEQIAKENDVNSLKVKCNDFVSKLEKYYKLFTNNVITEEEFKENKQKQINNIILYKVAEDPEDFLAVIIDLKTKGVLTDEELQKIKKAIL